MKLLVLSLSADVDDLLDLIDTLTRTIFKPLKFEEIRQNPPEDLFVVNAYQPEYGPEDYSVETEPTSDSTATTFYEMTSEPTTNSPNESNEILEMTANYHKLRVKVVNLTHTIQKQQDIIVQQTKKIRDLENSLKKGKTLSDKKLVELKAKNEKCRIDYNSVSSDLQIAKKLISIEKYSSALRRKLKEFRMSGNE